MIRAENHYEIDIEVSCHIPEKKPVNERNYGGNKKVFKLERKDESEFDRRS